MSSATARSADADPLDSVEDVDIDSSGEYKYILITVWPKGDADNQKYIVRGYKWADYHMDILEKVEPKLLSKRIACKCTGGGWIEHRSQDKTISVYGVSQGFGQADHAIAVELLKEKYPNYADITTGYTGD